MTALEMYRKRIEQGITIETAFADAMFDADFRTLYPHLAADTTVEELQTIHATNRAAAIMRAMMDPQDYHLYRVVVETTA